MNPVISLRFAPPPDSRFFIGTDFDADSFPVVRVTRPSGGYVLLQPCGATCGRPFISLFEISREEYALLAAPRAADPLAKREIPRDEYLELAALLASGKVSKQGEFSQAHYEAMAASMVSGGHSSAPGQPGSP